MSRMFSDQEGIGEHTFQDLVVPTGCTTRSKKAEASALKGTILLPFPHARVPFAHTPFLAFPLDMTLSICYYNLC